MVPSSVAPPRTADLPAAPNRGGRDEHPESKQGRKAASPGHAGSGSGRVVCPVLPPGAEPLRPPGGQGRARGLAPLPVRDGTGREVVAGPGMALRDTTPSQSPRRHAAEASPRERNQSRAAGCWPLFLTGGRAAWRSRWQGCLGGQVLSLLDEMEEGQQGREVATARAALPAGVRGLRVRRRGGGSWWGGLGAGRVPSSRANPRESVRKCYPEEGF